MRQSKRLLFEVLESRQLLAADLIITEFVASNQDSLLDGSGASSDWIEIFNNGDQSIDLAGHALTDDPDELDKWEFPSRLLGAGEYLVVFASGNATPDPAGNLHTNFSLAAGGEYLALSDPSGTVLSEFGSSAENYPALGSDEAYGLAFDSIVSAVVTPTSGVRYLIPTNNAVDAHWTGNAFNDSAWQSGTASLGFEDTPADFQDLILTPVPQGTASLYVRIPFTVTDPNTLLDTLQMKYDDGFIAYLNGTRITSANAPALSGYNSVATAQHPDGLAVDFVDFDVSAYSGALVVGSNTLAIHLLNRNSSSSDLLMAPRLTTTTGGLLLPPVEGRLLAPTPARPNTNVLAGAVEFSRVGGAFAGSFQLTMSSAGPNETIRYTTDGTLPTAASPAYSGAITVSATTQFHARAYGPVGQLGPVTVETYSHTEASTFSFTSDLPIVVIENLGQGVPGEEFEDAALALYDIDEETGRSALSHPADVTTLIGQHRRGSSTLNNPKPNLRIELRDAFGEDQSMSLLGMPDESDWILSGPYRFDRAMIRDTLLHDLSNQMGRYAVRTRFVEVYANTNGGSLDGGDYLGVYVLMENIKRDGDRVDIDALEPGHNSEPEITGGYIIKIDRADGESGSSWSTSRGVPNRGGARFVHVEPERADMTDEQVSYIRGYVQDLEDALYGPNSTDPILGYEAYLDVEASIDHHILRVFSLEPDALGLSTFLTKDRDGKLSFGPLWDSDRSMGSDGDLRSSNPEAWFSGVDFFEFDWWGELFKDPDFLQGWVDRWQELRQTTLSDANLLATINAQASQLAEAQARNFARWPEVAPNGGEFAQPGLTGWEAEVSHLAGWVLARASWIDGQLIAAPTLAPNPGNVSAGVQVVLASNQPGADIYYTLDGTDPRSEGGGISPTAMLFTAPIAINATTQVTARAMGTPAESVGQTPGVSPWSRAVAGLYAVEVPASSANLRITELHYHPADPSPSELNAVPGTDEDDFEFVELLNVSDDAISLNQVRLGEAVDFDFSTGLITSLAPGETALVVKNIAAFEARYGTGFPIAGEYSGKFADSGERVTLADSTGLLIHDFTYSDAAPWPAAADGDGPSLEVIDALGSLSQPTNWRISAADGGTPGVAQALGLVGDYDRNGFVEEADYGIWRSTFGSTVDLRADGNGDQVVDAADYTVWRDNLGQPAVASLAVATAALDGSVSPVGVKAEAVAALAAPFEDGQALKSDAWVQAAYSQLVASQVAPTAKLPRGRHEASSDLAQPQTSPAVHPWSRDTAFLRHELQSGDRRAVRDASTGRPHGLGGAGSKASRAVDEVFAEWTAFRRGHNVQGSALSDSR
ncbi:CotH protein [Pirellulimonas nuda]|uniref:CotH protein n=1 Tax=Pirellulimonas nuda TaxID=2528009 RepID=A0A518DCN8_9BACT|nr:CotH kinase family protein [Pirellulimonas nuda]QDU89254.1 CotH protein [Pirellulimonas nuda]